MIVLEITDASISHYDILSLKKEELDALDDNALSKAVRNAAKKAKKPYTQAAQRGDKEAERQEELINNASIDLQNREKKDHYDKTLASGKGALLEILQVQLVEAPFFRDRQARFRAIEHMLRRAGMTQPSMLEAHLFS